MVSLSPFGRLRVFIVSLSDHPSASSGWSTNDHGEPVTLRRAQGFHGEPVEPSFGKLRVKMVSHSTIQWDISIPTARGWHPAFA